jgi:AmmeMemoRadiSam system protein B
MSWSGEIYKFLKGIKIGQICMRRPAVAGMFYPSSSMELRETIESALRGVKYDLNAYGVVVPHAGYVFCSKVAAHAYKALRAFETAVIIGPNHYGVGASPALSAVDWMTPLGVAKVDKEFVEALSKDYLVDETAHRMEHSVEVQIPWLQVLFKDFKFVPIAINPADFKKDTCRALGLKIADVAKQLGRKIVVIASSDFTHHGPQYNYTPFGSKPSQILKKMEEVDLAIAKEVSEIMPEKVIEDVQTKDLTICGYGCISSMLWAVRELGAKSGKILSYSTSFEVSRSADAIVGYCSIAVY